MNRTEEIIIYVAVAVVSIPLFLFVHYFYSWLFLLYVKNYCRKRSIPFTKWRLAPAFDAQGIKTEKTLVDVLSESQTGKKIFRFEVWPLGIKNVSEIQNENGA